MEVRGSRGPSSGHFGHGDGEIDESNRILARSITKVAQAGEHGTRRNGREALAALAT